MAERDALRVYNKILHDIAEPHLGNTTTYASDLSSFATCMLGPKFHGVYAADRVPRLTKKRPYCIANLDTSDKPGSHWVALALNPATNQTLYYDSFGRGYSETLGRNAKPTRVIDTDQDAEQVVSELNCGARSISWLLVCDTWGHIIAQFI